MGTQELWPRGHTSSPWNQRPNRYGTQTRLTGTLGRGAGWLPILGTLATGPQPHPTNSVQSPDSEGLPEAVS